MARFHRTPGGIQTHDLQNRNLTFYSAELRGHLQPAEPSTNAGAKVQKLFERFERFKRFEDSRDSKDSRDLRDLRDSN